MLTVEEYKQAELEFTLDEAQRGFRIHAIVYALVMTGLIVLNALLIAYTEANFPWAVFPLVGWGVGLAFHYVGAFRTGGKDVRDRQEKIEVYAAHRHAA